MLKRLRLAIAVSLIVPGVLRAQQQVTPAQTVANPTASTPTAPAATPDTPVSTNTVCGQPVPTPRALPPTDIGPVLYQLVPCFEAQDNVSLVDIQTYLYYIQTKSSRPSESLWIRYDAEVEKSLLEDFKRLWGTNFLDNLSIESFDYVFSNGVIGKLIVYNMEERQRVKIVDYVGSKKLESTKIDEKLKENNAQVRLDTFIDPGLIRKVEGIVRDMLKEKGFQSASVTHEIKEVPGGPKLVHLTFNLDEGPKVKIRQIDFIGNKAIDDSTLRKQMKENRAQWWLSWITGRGTYQETKFEEDAERVTEYYRNEGYVRAQVGEPEVKVLEDSPDKKTRYIELRIPVTEGQRYVVGSFDVTGNTVVKSDLLAPLFKLKKGEYYSQKNVRKGFQKAQEIYGAAGYMEFSGYPDYKFSDEPVDPEAGPTRSGDAAPAPDASHATPAEGHKGPPSVDVTLRIQEGKQYFVNRITFSGNTTTRDSVIRRELRLYEDGVFNTEALKFSIKRLNQLGYFKALEGPGKDVTVDKTPNTENKVDVRMKLEEQNRNQLTFGAGVSQFEGFFGQMSFQTANFLGRGESLTLSVQAGQLAKNYTLAFTEPFLFDRNITGGFNLFRSDVRYISQFTQQSTGGVLTFGFPLGNGFTRMFTNYSYETVHVSQINSAYCDPLLLARNPFLRDSLLLGGTGCLTAAPGSTVEVAGGGERRISKVVPSIVHNTVDQPIFPTTGKRITLSLEVAGIGGNTSFYKPTAEFVSFFKQNSRMSFGFRTQVMYITPYGSTLDLPIFEKIFLGGEYTVRGFDLRTIGPHDPYTGLVLGGNKSLLFNAEQIISIAGPVRLILFYDAGQVRDTGQPFTWMENLTQIVPVTPPLLSDPLAAVTLSDPSVKAKVQVIDRVSAFKTSTGAEIRFFMPVLNVPFRLIFAYNPQRAGVLNNNLQPQSAFQFRFAVGTTF